MTMALKPFNVAFHSMNDDGKALSVEVHPEGWVAITVHYENPMVIATVELGEDETMHLYNLLEQALFGSLEADEEEAL